MRLVHLLVAASLLIIPGSWVSAQESDHRIIPGQRVGHWELGKPLLTYQLGPARYRWEDKDNGIPIIDAYNFLASPSGPSLHVRTCKGNPGVFQIVIHRWTTLPPHIEAEAFKYKTTDGLGIGSDGADVVRLHGRPVGSAEWTERHGTIDISAVAYGYRGLVFLINRGDRKVFGLGAETPDGWSECHMAAFGGRAATQRQDLTLPGPLGVPLPRNLRVVPPAGDIPARYAGMTGHWVGVNKYGYPHVLVVEQILLGPPRAIVVSSWGGRGGTWQRFVGRFTAEELILGLRRGSPCYEACTVFFRYRLINQDSLEARYDENEPEHSYAFLMSRPRN